MKNTKNLIFFVLMSLATSLGYAHEHTKGLKDTDTDMNYDIDNAKYPRWANFVKKYRCPADIEDKIKSNSKKSFVVRLTDDESEQLKQLEDDLMKSNYSEESLNKRSAFMKNHQTYQSFYIKNRNIDRVINAGRIRDIITMYNLEHIGVPLKYICKMGNKWKVVAEGIPAAGEEEQNKNLSLIEVQELAKILEETGYNDFGEPGNLTRGIDDKLYFVDTENSSFMHLSTDDDELGIKHRCKMKNVRTLVNMPMSAEAREWLERRVNELKNSEEGMKEFKPLPLNPKYGDNPLIEFQDTIEEMRAFLKNEPTNVLAKTGVLKNGDISMWGACDNQKVRDAIIQAKNSGKQIDLRGTDLSGLDLSDMDLSGINFEGCVMNQVNFTNSKITGANFSKIVEFFWSDFSNVDTSQANFDHSRMDHLNGFSTVK